MKIKALSILSAAVLVLALGSVAKADSFTDSNGNLWTVAIAPDSDGEANTFDVILTVNTVNGGGFLMGWSLGNANTGGWGNNATGFALDPGNTALGTGPINPGGTGGCKNNVTESACLNINPGLALDGSTYSWTIDVTMSSGSFSAVHVQALYSPSSTDPSANGAHNLISQDIDGGTPNNPVPEPGSLALFGTGALGLAGYLRRKLFA